MRYRHIRSGKIATVHSFADGRCRVAAYVPGDAQWKAESKQLRVTEAQAHAVIARKENYVGVSWGVGSRALVHSRFLEPIH